MLDVIVGVLGAVLIVLGVGLWSIPAALVIAGLILLSTATLVDFTARSGRSSE